MSVRVVLNPGSLNLVRPELSLLVKQAQGEFDLAMQPDAAHGVEGCRAILAQVDGVLRLVELGDAACLARELADVLATHPPAGSRAAQAAVHVFFVLSRYLDYLAARRHAAPELLVEEINALRSLQGKAPLAEWHFAAGEFTTGGHAPGVPARSSDPGTIKRLRHMYQVGLLGLMKGRQDPVNHHLVQRAVSRMLRIAGGGADADFWWLLDALLEAVATAEINLSPSRMRLLSRADRQFRDAASGSSAALDQEQRTGFLLLLAKCRVSPRALAVRQSLGIERAALADRELAEERRLLMGTSVASIDSMARALRGDVLQVKTALEQAAEIGGLPDAALGAIRDTLRRVAGTLRDGGLAGSATTLEAQLDRVAAGASGQGLSRAEITSVADALVAVEATLAGLASPQGLARVLREQMGGGAGQGASRQMLDDARVAMLQSAREAIEQVKNGVTAYVEGDYDAALLEGSAGHLAAVRGALLMLEREAAAKLVAETAAMVEQAARGERASSPESFAESLADLLICIEYYLTALEHSEDPDPLMLKLGQESLIAMRGSLSAGP